MVHSRWSVTSRARCRPSGCTPLHGIIRGSCWGGGGLLSGGQRTPRSWKETMQFYHSQVMFQKKNLRYCNQASSSDKSPLDCYIYVQGCRQDLLLVGAILSEVCMAEGWRQINVEYMYFFHLGWGPWLPMITPLSNAPAM